MNHINRKRHLEICVTCKEKDKSGSIAKFFKKDESQETPKGQIMEHSIVEIEEHTSSTSAIDEELPIHGTEEKNSAGFVRLKSVEDGETPLERLMVLYHKLSKCQIL